MKKVYQVFKSKGLQHSVFWVLSIYAIGDYFSISNFLKFIDFFYAVLFHIPLVFLVYVNLRLLIPKFLQKGRWFLYALTVPLLLGTTYGLHELTFEVLFPLLDTEFYMVSFTDWQVLVTIFTIYLVLTTLLKLSKSWYTLQQVQKEKLAIELRALKEQVNPHFLFNSLNSIYAMSMAGNKKTPEAVLELSSLLRYMLYEAGEEQVPLSREIEMLEQYIALQQLRADDSTDIQLIVEGQPDDVNIFPLLFFPLLENSFKHGVKTVSESAYVHLKIVVKNGLHLTLKNNVGENKSIDSLGGIGLENVKRRLSLLYPDRHRFEVEAGDEDFTVNLSIL